ncbi:capsid protein [robinz virus RP_390]|nr:capsid protein [robinz virus RP_390]
MPRYAKKTTRRRKYVKKRATKRSVSSGRKRKTTMTYKRIKKITAVKKKDTMVIGQHPPGDVQGTPSPFINQVMDGQVAMYYFSPSYMPFRPESAYGRSSARVHHTSFAEKFEIEIGCDVSLLHRRIVFSNGYDDVRAICVQNKNTLRNLTKVEQGDFEDLFQGTKNVDWFDIFKVPMDRKRVTVMSDKLYTYTPKNPHGQAFPRKFYHKINKWYNFPDREHGDEELISNYNWPGIKSPKVFIFDIFKSFRDTRNSPAFPLGEQYWSLGIQATNYWTEEPS